MRRRKLPREVILSDVAALKKFAARMAPILRVTDVVAMDGALGAGKTELCRALIHALGFSGEVPSPTFTLLQIYQPGTTTPPVWHMDLYRLECPEEALELGIEDGFERGISLIEWPAKLGRYLPTGYLTLRLEIITQDDNARRLTIIGGEDWASRLENTHFDD